MLCYVTISPWMNDVVVLALFGVDLYFVSSVKRKRYDQSLSTSIFSSFIDIHKRQSHRPTTKKNTRTYKFKKRCTKAIVVVYKNDQEFSIRCQFVIKHHKLIVITVIYKTIYISSYEYPRTECYCISAIKIPESHSSCVIHISSYENDGYRDDDDDADDDHNDHLWLLL